jgi:hypothetical protein
VTVLIVTECNPSDYRLAFMNFRFLQAVGALLAFSLSSVLCNYLKLYILVGLLGLSISCYVALEHSVRQRAQVDNEQHSSSKTVKLIQKNCTDGAAREQNCADVTC